MKVVIAVLMGTLMMSALFSFGLALNGSYRAREELNNGLSVGQAVIIYKSLNPISAYTYKDYLINNSNIQPEHVKILEEAR